MALSESDTVQNLLTRKSKRVNEMNPILLGSIFLLTDINLSVIKAENKDRHY